MIENQDLKELASSEIDNLNFPEESSNLFYYPMLIITYQESIGLGAAYLGKLFLQNSEKIEFGKNKLYTIFLIYAIISIIFLITSIRLCIIKNPNHNWKYYIYNTNYCKIIVLITSFTIHFCLNYCFGQSQKIFIQFQSLEILKDFWIEKICIVEHTIFILIYSSFSENLEFFTIFKISFIEFLINFFISNLFYNIILSSIICSIAFIESNLLNCGITLTNFNDTLNKKNHWVGVLSIRYYQYLIFGYFGMIYYYSLFFFFFLLLSSIKLIELLSNDDDKRYKSRDNLIDRIRVGVKICDVI